MGLSSGRPVCGLAPRGASDQPAFATAYHDDSDLLEQVADYDSRREEIEQTAPEQQRMVDKFGICTEYGWSENRTRQYAVPARADFGQYIRDQGFDLS